jgi:ketosteroid isomerase-like protein
MSRSAEEVVRALYAAAATGDADAVMACYAEDVVWDASRTQRGGLSGRVVHGREGLRAWFRDWYEPWQAIEDRLEEIVAVDRDRVVALMVQRARGKSSGIEVQDQLSAIWTVRGDAIVEVVWFPDAAAAFEAAGVER